MGRKRNTNTALITTARDVLQHWNEYYASTDFGIGIQCSQCQKWRLSYQYQESKEVPTDWDCSMWKISKKKRGNCNIPSSLTEDDFAVEEFSPGTVVWAKFPGFPPWPGMVEDCADKQEFYEKLENGEEMYHVNFFGEKPTRSWIKASRITEFEKPPPEISNKSFKLSPSLMKSIEQAEEAAELTLKERLKKYSFAVRYNGRWAKLRNKDDVLLPPTCPSLKELAKSAEAKSLARNAERPVNGSGRRSPKPRKRKRALGSQKTVGRKKRRAMDVAARLSDNNSKRAPTAETPFIIRRNVSCFIRYQNPLVPEYTGRDSTESMDNGDRSQDNPSENDGATADNEDSEDNDDPEEVDGERSLSQPASPVSEYENLYSSDDDSEELPCVKAYREFISKKYPSFLEQLFPDDSKEDVVTTA